MFGLKTKKPRFARIKLVENKYGTKTYQEICPACGNELIWDSYRERFCRNCGQEILREEPKPRKQTMLEKWKENNYD